MNEIDFYEKKDDIEEAVKDLGFGELKYIKRPTEQIPYIDLNSDICVTIEEGEENFKTTVFQNGYKIENPNYRKYMEKEYDVEEFLDMIKNLKTEYFNSKPITDDEVINEGPLKLIGITLKKRATWDEYDNSYEKNETNAIIIYGESKNKDIYRIECMETYGMCYSGYTTASWGHYDICKVNEIDKDKLIYTPNKKVTIEFNRNDDIINIEIKRGKTSLIRVQIDYNGGDSYYPTGSVDIYPQLHLEDVDTIPKEIKEILDCNEENLISILNEKEFEIPSPDSYYDENSLEY